jgi:hypothetical protein
MKNNGLNASVGNVGNVQIQRFQRPALQKGVTVGNVGNPYRFPTFQRPRCAAVSEGVK